MRLHTVQLIKPPEPTREKVLYTTDIRGRKLAYRQLNGDKLTL